LGIILDVIIFAFLGAVLGFIIPFIAAQIYVMRIRAKHGNEADFTAAGAVSFMPIVTVPLGVGFGFLFGVLRVVPIFGG